MDRIRNIHHPFDNAFTLMFEEFPEEFIEVLGAPGKFVKKANIRVKLPNGKTGEMDTPYIADPDGKTIFERSLVLLEHQRLVVRYEKGLMISNYVIQGVHDEKLPYYVAIASHEDSSRHLQEFDRNGSFITRLKFIDLGERDNWERLYRIRNKLRFNRNLSLKDGLNLGIVVLFAPTDCAKQRTIEALHYLLESEITSKKLELVLYTVFYFMIDVYFDDDEFERMIEMLDENVNDETTEKFNMQVRLENRIKYMQKDIDELSARNDKISAEKEELSARNIKISAEKEELSARNDELSARNDELSAENIKISAEKEEISVERDQILYFISKFSNLVEIDDDEVKKFLSSFKNILKNYNVEHV